MTATVAVPIWAILVFAVLAVVWQIAGAMRDRAMTELWRIYHEHAYPPIPDAQLRRQPSKGEER